MQVLNGLPQHVKVVDLSADFRLRDVATYAEWYGGEHKAPQLQAEAVYGLTELHRAAVADARLVANPGCYPTSVQLPLVPLVKAGLISSEGIIIDAKSGVSGAGRAAKEGTLFCEARTWPPSPPPVRHLHLPSTTWHVVGRETAAGMHCRSRRSPHIIAGGDPLFCYWTSAEGPLRCVWRALSRTGTAPAMHAVGTH